MEIKTIGVLGAGQMGSGIAQIAASRGYNVILRDIKQDFCDNALIKIRVGMEKQVAAGKITKEIVETTMSNITTCINLVDIRDCDMVIEAAPENLDLKRSTFKELGEICRPDAIFCTNTSSMSVTEIFSECKKPERCAGMHFFFPVMVMKLVEIIRGAKTDDDTVATIKTVAFGMGKTAVDCKLDTPGFIVNRCLFAFLLEAIQCYKEGVATVSDIDTAIKLGLNHPLGPFELMDLSGMDIFPHVCESLSTLPVTSWDCPDIITDMIAEGKLGRKAKQGWYIYK